MYSKLFRNVIFSVTEISHGTKIQKYMKWLNKTQWWKPEELEELQNKKLRALIKHAYDNVPYYHQLFRKLDFKPEDIKKKEDLTKLPILTKSIAQKNYPAGLRAKNSSNKNILPWSSGGSTGQPVQFFRDKNELSFDWAAAFRGWGWAGYELGDRYATLWDSPVVVTKHKKYLKQIEDRVRRNLFSSIYSLDNRSMDIFIEKLRKHKPKIIRGYSNSIFLLAEFMRSKEICDINPKAILTTSDTLFRYRRERIESQFKCTVFDGYGGGEAPAAAYECGEHEGYHISAENMILEFIKDNEQVSQGEMGKILITNLNSHAAPFIRYEIGDIGKPSNELCPCGRGLPMIESIEGRINDFIVTPEGKAIHSYFFPELFKDMHSVKQFQVIQESKEKLLIKLVKTQDFSDKDGNFIISNVRKLVGDEMKIETEFVNSIPVTGSGKRRFVISKVPIDVLWK